MTKRSMFEDDPLEDFTRREITLGENTKRVYVSGTGPRDVIKGFARSFDRHRSGGHQIEFSILFRTTLASVRP